MIMQTLVHVDKAMADVLLKKLQSIPFLLEEQVKTP